MHRYRNGSGNSIAPPEISGIAVTRQKRTKKERAALAAAIARGETELTRLTQAQISKVCGVSASYVCQMQRKNSIPVVVQLQAAE
jgi:hypothetical protein